MAISFGNTWWGQQWLGALDRIDFSNRLPRGKSYANKGAVTSIKIKGNQIEAKVQGTRKTPYKVSIIVPPYYEEHTSVFMDAIKSNPLVLAKLLNRELPQELMEIAEQSGIKIFPSSWQDIKLNCSCPDWAVPCKHLAAVIYIIANEIDKNPFLVFKLHNFDILEHLKEVESNVKTEEKQPILNPSKIAFGKKNLPEFNPNDETFDLLDFSTIPELTKQIISLYPSKTLFFNGDFQALLTQHYKTKIKSFNKQEDVSDVDILPFMKVRNSRIFVSFRPSGEAVIQYQYAQDEKKTIAIDDLCALLNETSAKHIYNYSNYFSALYYIFHYCKRLIKQGALLPQLIETGETGYKIRWAPALINKNVKAIFDLLQQITPPDFCCLETKNKKGEVSEKFFPSDENLKSLCSLLIDYYFKSAEISKMRLGNESAVSHNTKVAELFFLPEPQFFNTFTEKEIPNSIQLWLNRFNIARKDFAPVLAIDEFAEHFECKVLVESKDKPFEAPVALSEFMSDISRLPLQIELAKDLAMLAEYMPELNEIIKTSGRKQIRFDSMTVVEILEKTLPALELFGIRVLLPKSLQQILKPQVSMMIRRKDQKTFFSLDELLAFDWRVALGDYLITEEEFKALSKNAGQLIRIKDGYALLTEDEIKRIIKSLSTTRDISSLKLLQSVLSEEYEGAKVEIDEELRKEIRKLLQEEETPLPQNLLASLRPYQIRGFNWMYKNARLGFGSVLADDMGLGKTLQVIATLLKFKEEGRLKEHPALVVAPTTLLTNWDKEIRKFAPGLNAVIYHGLGRRFDPKSVSGIDVLLTSYGIARSESDKFKKVDWHTIIIDEAQNIKNSETAQAKSIKQLKGKIKIAMSGTPVENRLSEYWSIFDFSNTGYLGNLSFFNEHFAKPIELNKDRKKLEHFRKITQPFILRREKSDKSIISDLPDKIENNQYCMLSPEQISLYNATVEKNLAAVESSEGVERQGLILRLLSSLKQICNHPSQYLKKDDYTPSLSGKTEMLFQLLDNIYESGEKALIFSQYAEMGSILLEMIYERYNKKALFLHGGCTRKQRDEMVDDFQNRPDMDTFILSLKAGGTGLNLTAAANVIHYDLWWNPAVEAQATDRAFRIGQQKNVMVYRFITKNTLEEKIDLMMQSKKELANLTVSKGESWIGNLNDKDLKELIML
jgi:SNF2 family DNA or RNA helicase/uncharacterized Zn finger protein